MTFPTTAPSSPRAVGRCGSRSARSCASVFPSGRLRSGYRTMRSQPARQNRAAPVETVQAGAADSQAPRARRTQSRPWLTA